MKEISKPKKKKELEVGDEIEIVRYKTGNMGVLENSVGTLGAELEVFLIEIKSIRKVVVEFNDKK